MREQIGSRSHSRALTAVTLSIALVLAPACKKELSADETACATAKRWCELRSECSAQPFDCEQNPCGESGVLTGCDGALATAALDLLEDMTCEELVAQTGDPREAPDEYNDAILSCDFCCD